MGSALEHVLFWIAQHELSLQNNHSQLNDKSATGTPILHAEASFHHLSKDRITARDLEPNLSQMSQSFWIISKACDFRLQTTQKACDFWRTAAFSLSFVCCVVIADFNLKKFECMCFVENLKRLIEVILLKCRK